MLFTVIFFSDELNDIVEAISNLFILVLRNTN